MPYVRSAWTARTGLQQNYRANLGAIGDADTDASEYFDQVAGSDPYLNQIRAISVPMGQLRQRINNELNGVSSADASLNVDQLVADLRQMESYQQQLQAAITAYQQSPAYSADAQTAAMLNNWLAFIQAWASSVGQAIAQLPTDLANYIGSQISNVGMAAIGASVPWLIGGALVLWLVVEAEKTRTYRKVVA